MSVDLASKVGGAYLDYGYKDAQNKVFINGMEAISNNLGDAVTKLGAQGLETTQAASELFKKMFSGVGVAAEGVGEGVASAGRSIGETVNTMKGAMIIGSYVVIAVGALYVLRSLPEGKPKKTGPVMMTDGLGQTWQLKQPKLR